MRWKTFGRLLEEARRRARLTQEQLAELLSEETGAEISQQSVNQWCRGQYRPGDRRTFVVLCRVLYDTGGLASLREVNSLLREAHHGALHIEELEEWFRGVAEMTMQPGHQGQEGEPNELPQMRMPGTQAETVVGNGASAGQPEVGENETVSRGSGSGAGRASTRSSEGEWFHAVVAPVWGIRQVVRTPERYGGLGVVMLVTGLIGEGWHLLAHHLYPLGAGWWWLASIWGGSLLLAWPPSLEELKPSPTPLWVRRVFRLCGTLCGVTTLVWLLVWVDALSHILWGVHISRGVTYGLSAWGALVAYAGGLSLQHAFQRQSPERQPVLKRTTAEVILVMSVFQALAGWYLCVLHPHLDQRLLLFLPAVALLVLSRRPRLAFRWKFAVRRRQQSARERQMVEVPEMVGAPTRQDAHGHSPGLSSTRI